MVKADAFVTTEAAAKLAHVDIRTIKKMVGRWLA